MVWEGAERSGKSTAQGQWHGLLATGMKGESPVGAVREGYFTSYALEENALLRTYKLEHQIPQVHYVVARLGLGHHLYHVLTRVQR